jgi:hypothetical protein
MARVHVSFDGGSVPIVMGAMPDDPATPIVDGTDTGYLTNETVIIAEGEYCFGLQTAQPYTPLWQIVDALDGQRVDIAFRTVP